MKISGSSVLHASPDRVWAAITDPAVLSAVIPGCDVLTPTAANTFALTVTLGVASIKGSYTGEVSFSDLVEPASLTMRAKGSGGPGTIDTTVAVVLTGLSDGSTRLDYDADAMVGGMVGGVGQRVLAGVAKKTAGLFFAAIDEVLTGARPLVPAAAVVAGNQPSITAIPDRDRRPARASPWRVRTDRCRRFRRGLHAGRRACRRANCRTPPLSFDPRQELRSTAKGLDPPVSSVLEWCPAVCSRTACRGECGDHPGSGALLLVHYCGPDLGNASRRRLSRAGGPGVGRDHHPRHVSHCVDRDAQRTGSCARLPPATPAGPSASAAGGSDLAATGQPGGLFVGSTARRLRPRRRCALHPLCRRPDVFRWPIPGSAHGVPDQWCAKDRPRGRFPGEPRENPRPPSSSTAGGDRDRGQRTQQRRSAGVRPASGHPARLPGQRADRRESSGAQQFSRAPVGSDFLGCGPESGPRRSIAIGVRRCRLGSIARRGRSGVSPVRLTWSAPRWTGPGLSDAVIGDAGPAPSDAALRAELALLG